MKFQFKTILTIQFQEEVVHHGTETGRKVLYLVPKTIELSLNIEFSYHALARLLPPLINFKLKSDEFVFVPID